MACICIIRCSSSACKRLLMAYPTCQSSPPAGLYLPLDGTSGCLCSHKSLTNTWWICRQIINGIIRRGQRLMVGDWHCLGTEQELFCCQCIVSNRILIWWTSGTPCTREYTHEWHFNRLRNKLYASYEFIW